MLDPVSVSCSRCVATQSYHTNMSITINLRMSPKPLVRPRFLGASDLLIFKVTFREGQSFGAEDTAAQLNCRSQLASGPSARRVIAAHTCRLPFPTC